jgi:lysophospholipase L1-like esterase
MTSKRYVALGSSMAAGPGITPRAPGSPWTAGRSARNYPHLVAEALGLDLTDVTYSGATTAHVLGESQRGAPPQIDALDSSEALVTVTIGGNDVGYVPMLFAAALPGPMRSIPLLGNRIREMLDRTARDHALEQVADALMEVGTAVRTRSPHATVLFVDYLTLLPPAGTPAPPLGEADVSLGRHIAATLQRLTAAAAAATGCGVVRAGDASRDHHAWSAQPWTTLPNRFSLPSPRRPAPLHPNAQGMRAVADLVIAAVPA